MTDLLEGFRAAASAAAGDVRELPGLEQLAAWCAELAGSSPMAVAPALLAARPPLRAALHAAGAVILEPDDEDAVAEVADAPVGLAGGELGIAETGSVLVAEHRVADRVVTLLVRHLLLVIDRDQLVGSLDSVAEWLSARAGESGFASLVTGPSRSADIERSLSIGVQGPEAVTMVVLG